MSSHTRPRTQTQRGRSGKKWVGLNYKEKENAKEANGGIMPYTLSLVTSDFPHRDEWSEIDLPDILFYIQPPTSRYEGVKIDYLIEDGKTVISDAADGHEIRQFEILPRHISLDAPGWLVEAWRRLDSRIGYQDILDRQYADPNLGLKKHTKNALQNHCRRECRKVLNAWVEYGRRDEPHRTEVEAIEGLSYENIQLNTILKRSERFSDRLVKVRLERRVEDGLYYAIPRKVTMENWRETTLPINHFLPDNQPREMTPSMHAAWEMYLVLMERAAVHGYGHWVKLDRSCLPVTWYDRTSVKSVPNDTYDGGCVTCTWSVEREILTNPNVKLEPDDALSATKPSKRRRSESQAELWDLGDTPKAPKRRNATGLSSRRQRSDRDSSPAIDDITFVETYRRAPEDYEYYSVSPDGKVREHGEADPYGDFKEGSLSRDDVDEEGSEYECSEDEDVEEEEETEDDRSTPYSCVVSDPLSPDDEDVTGPRSNSEADDRFNSPSATRSYRRTNYRRVQDAATVFSSPPRYDSQAEAWLRSSNLPRSESSYQELDYDSSIVDNTVLPTDVGGMPGYLPASVFLNHHSRNATISTQETRSNHVSYETSFTSTETLPGASFSSNNASILTAASSFTEASHRATGRGYGLPTPTTTDFPISYFYPLPMTQSQGAYHSLSYPSPPQITTHPHQMSFNSSPPRRPEPDWEWTQNRTRRHSDTDAALGLPSDFAGIGAFEQDLTAISSYLDEQKYDEALSLTQIAHFNDYADSQAFESDDFGNKNDPGQGNGDDDTAIGPMIGNSFDNDFMGEQVNPTIGSLSVLHF